MFSFLEISVFTFGVGLVYLTVALVVGSPNATGIAKLDNVFMRYFSNNPTTRRRDWIKLTPRRHATCVCWWQLGSTQMPLLRKRAVPLILPHLVMRRFSLRKPSNLKTSQAT